MYQKENFDRFVWTSGFQRSLAHTDFHMLMGEWMSANKSPGTVYDLKIKLLIW